MESFTLTTLRPHAALLLIILGALLPGLVRAQTNNYFGTTGTLNGNVWGTTASGPYTSALNTTGGAIINFGNATTSITGASITVAGINATANATITTIGGTISNLSNGIVPISVGSGATLDFAGNSFTSSATAGYIKNGGGVLALAGNTYGGGFTLNDGTVILRGVNAMGSGGTLTINGGTIAANATRDLTGKYGGGIVIGGNFTLGATTGLALSAANLTFNNNVSLGSTTRTITLGGTGTYTFSGTISGSGGLGVDATAAGTLALVTGNTYTGKTTLSGGTVSTSGESAFGGNPGAFVADQITFSGGTLVASGSINFSSNRGLTLGTGGGTFNSNGNTITLTNVVTGTGSLTMAGNGTLSLPSAHTYSGDTILAANAGMLSLGNVNALQNSTLDTGSSGTQSVTFSVAGTNTYNVGGLKGADALDIGGNTLSVGANNQSTSYSGVLSGTAGKLTKVGSGTLTLSTPFTHTGVTTVSAGTLSIASQTLASTNPISVANAAALNTTGTLRFNANGTAIYNAIAGTGTGVLNLRSNTSSAASPDISFNDNDVANATTNYGTRITAAVDLGSSQRFVWGKTNHNSVSNYLASTGPDAEFKGAISGSGGLTFIAQHSYTASGVMEVPFVLSAANTFTGMVEVQRGSVYLNNATALTQGNVLNFTPSSGNNARLFLFGNNASVSNLQSSGAGAALIANGNVTNATAIAAATLTVNQTSNTAYSGTLVDAQAEYDRTLGSSSGALSLLKTGTGTLTLNSGSTFSGGTTIRSGQVTAGNSTALGTGSVTLNDTSTGSATTTLQITSGITLANAITLANQGTGIATLSATGTAISTFSGAVTLNKSVTVNNTNSFATFTGGQLTNGGLNMTGSITGTGGITFTGGQVTRLATGTNTYSGPTTITGNSVLYLWNAVSSSQNSSYQIDAGSFLVHDTLSSGGGGKLGGLTGAGTLQATSNGTSNIQVGYLGNTDLFTGSVAGPTNFNKQGTGTQIFAGANSYTGSTTITGGTLQVGNGGTTGSLGSTSSITNNGTLKVHRSDSYTLPVAMSGSGGLIQSGSGTTRLTVASTYSGGTVVSAGRLEVANTTGSATGSGNVQVTGSIIFGSGIVSPNSGATITIGSGSTVSVGGAGDTTGKILTFTPVSGTLSTTLQTGSILELDLFSGAGLGDQSSTPAAADIFRTGGSLAIGTGVKLRVNGNGMTAFAENDKWLIFDWATLGGSAPTGTFDTALLELPTLTGSLVWDLSSLYTSGIIVVAVPEPSRALLLVCGLLGLLVRRRRRA